MAAIPRMPSYDGPALFSYGFRPFFLLGAIYSGLAVLAWIPMFYGHVGLTSAFGPRDWHVHEMLYGYLPAIVTGFLLTAIPNWTGRLPLNGRPLQALVAIWLAGRIAVTFSATIGPLAAALIDVSFLLVVIASAAREILAGKNWHNLNVLVLVTVLALGNAAFHWEAHTYGVAEVSARVGIAVIVLLITLIGGRIIPSFTRNWLARENQGRLPVPLNRFDFATIAIGGAAMVLWCVTPNWTPTGVALIVAGIAHTARLARWAGERTFRNPLLLVLHVAYAFVPVGFFLLGGAAFGWLLPTAGIHAWTGGAFGGMTIAVMSRASLGHTGRPLVASVAVQIIYALVFGATLARVAAAVAVSLATPLLYLAGVAWAAGFLGFAALFWPILTRPRVL